MWRAQMRCLKILAVSRGDAACDRVSHVPRIVHHHLETWKLGSKLEHTSHKSRMPILKGPEMLKFEERLNVWDLSQDFYLQKGDTENENEMVTALLHVGGHSHNYETRKEKKAISAVNTKTSQYNGWIVGRFYVMWLCHVTDAHHVTRLQIITALGTPAIRCTLAAIRTHKNLCVRNLR